MRLVKVFKTKKDLRSINQLLDDIQIANDDNRILNVQIEGNFAYITASVEVDILDATL